MFINDLKKHLDLAGIKILPAYEDDIRLVQMVQLHCGKDVPAVTMVEMLKTRITNNQVQFIPLPLPKTTQIAQLQRLDGIYVRYIEDFKLMSDDLIGRYDVLIRI